MRGLASMVRLAPHLPGTLLVARRSGELHVRVASDEDDPSRTWGSSEWFEMEPLFPGVLVVSELRQLRLWLRQQLLSAVLQTLDDLPRVAVRVSGLTLVRQVWERANDPEGQPRETQKRTVFRSLEDLRTWAGSVGSAPLPELPEEFARPLEAPRWRGRVMWAGSTLVSEGRPGGLNVTHVTPLRAHLCQQLSRELTWSPALGLVTRARPDPEDRDVTEAASAADPQFLQTLRDAGALEVSSGRYAGLRIELRQPDLVRLSIGIPEHVAEMPREDSFAHWPASRAGAEIRLDGTYGSRELYFFPDLRLRTWDRAMIWHPVVRCQRERDGGHVVCIAHSAHELARSMAADRVDDPGKVVAETLVCLRRAVLYGVNSHLPGPVYNPYETILEADRPPYPILKGEQAHQLARERNLEIVGWDW